MKWGGGGRFLGLVFHHFVTWAQVERRVRGQVIVGGAARMPTSAQQPQPEQLSDELQTSREVITNQTLPLIVCDDLI